MKAVPDDRKTEHMIGEQESGVRNTERIRRAKMHSESQEEINEKQIFSGSFNRYGLDALQRKSVVVFLEEKGYRDLV